MALELTIAAIVGYFAGSIPFGLLVARRRGVDIRAKGSGNIGATNVARNLGKKTGALVLLLDALKGALPCATAQVLESGGLVGLEAVAVAGFAAMIGHCFPVWLRFRGGKGVATALGVFLVVDPLVAGLGVLLFAGLYGAFRMASVGSVSAAAAFPVLLWALGRPQPILVLGIAGAALVIFKHRDNLVRIWRGDELKV